MTLTREQVIANIDAMEKQGAEQADIQSYLDTLPNPETSKPEQPQDATTASSQDVLAQYKAGQITQQQAREQLRGMRPTAEQFGGEAQLNPFEKIKKLMTVPEAKAEAPGILGGGTPTLQYLGETGVNAIKQAGSLIGAVGGAAGKALFSPIPEFKIYKPISEIKRDIKPIVKEAPAFIKGTAEELVKGTAESLGMTLTAEKGFKINPYITAAKLKREPINTAFDASIALGLGKKALFKALKGNLSKAAEKKLIKKAMESASKASAREAARTEAALAPSKTFRNIAFDNRKKITDIPFSSLENTNYAADRGTEISKLVTNLKDTHLQSTNTILKENAENIINIKPGLSRIYGELEAEGLGKTVSIKNTVPPVISPITTETGGQIITKPAIETTRKTFKLEPIFNKSKTGKVVAELPEEIIHNENVLSGIMNELDTLGDTITVRQADRLRKVLDKQIKWGRDDVTDIAAKKIRKLLSDEVKESLPSEYAKKQYASRESLENFKGLLTSMENVGTGEKFGLNDRLFSNKEIIKKLKETMENYSGISGTDDLSNKILGELDNLEAWHHWQTVSVGRLRVLPAAITKTLPIADIFSEAINKGISLGEYQYYKAKYAGQITKAMDTLLKAAIRTPKAVAPNIPVGVKIQEDIINQ